MYNSFLSRRYFECFRISISDLRPVFPMENYYLYIAKYLEKPNSMINTSWRKIELHQNKVVDKFFDFLSLDHYELHMNQWFDCYLEVWNLKARNWKL